MVYDECQIKAIESLENTLVIAGAGSGKTSTIVGKVNYFIDNKIYEPEEILIISFTNETVNSLKKKVNYNLDIKTFHKLALDIISNKNKINIVSSNYLSFIINEYFNSFALDNKKANILYKRIINYIDISNLKVLIENFINIYKSNYNSINYLINLYKKSFFIDKIYYKFILDIYLIYQRDLESTLSLDLNDLIIKATQLISKRKKKTKYKFIIIDEFQDTSLIRFNLIDALLKENDAKFFVVGDDYQSIYRFSGCDLNLFVNFKKYYPNTKVIYLNHNYRNSSELIKITSDFIMKNKRQLKKNTICHKNIVKPIKLNFYVDKRTVVNKVLKHIQGHTLILGRNNRDKEQFNVMDSENMRFLTIHRSKGLEEDNVILLNLENSVVGFPSKIKNERIISKILNTEYLMYEEERRLFYVALTRAKNYVYLLVPKNNYSVFIKELIKDFKTELDFIDID
ncbi:MAG: UvrD-helicase domain-containing protein [Bacilli bacterium]|nr:UvrD-helicase domain-containing protein [Bacilli bacterium]MDD4795570.1 UvrD-helicase domain-containing protein [Bacilli bacterium]